MTDFRMSRETAEALARVIEYVGVTPHMGPSYRPQCVKDVLAALERDLASAGARAAGEQLSETATRHAKERLRGPAPDEPACGIATNRSATDPRPCQKRAGHDGPHRHDFGIGSPPAPTWTREPPTEPGLYVAWDARMPFPHGLTVMMVRADGGRSWWTQNGTGSYDADWRYFDQPVPLTPPGEG